MPVYFGGIMHGGSKAKMALVVGVFFYANVVLAVSFPLGPDARVTQGSLCASSKIKRYPEGISFCERSVGSTLKNEIITVYDNTLGYQIHEMPRQDFKIDHLFPLRAGGSNEQDNLWPQHKTVYVITDPIEPLICQKMSEGRLKQEDAVQMVLYAKTHLDHVPEVLAQLNAL